MNLINSIQKFVRDEDGISTVEYGLVLALVGVVVASAMSNLGTTIRDQIELLKDNVAGLLQ